MDHPIEFERVFAAPPARLFAALVTPADLNVWAWAGMGAHPTAEVDLRVGGQFCIGVDGTPGDDWPRPRMNMRGMYIEVVPDRRLVHTLHWDAPVIYNQTGDAVPDEVVFIDLEPEGAASTKMRYLHRGVPLAAAAVEHRAGIDASHDMLATLLEA